MKSAFRRILYPLLFTTLGACAHAQFYEGIYHRLKGGEVTGGVSGQFTTVLTTNAGNYNSTSISSTAGGVLSQTVSGQQQFTTDSAGLLASFSFHPVAFAGIEFNYGYSKYSEIFTSNYSSTPTTLRTTRVPVTTNEATAAYEFHPPHIPLQPFVNIGGGAISFLPQLASNQWRGVGLLETGLDIPTHIKHLSLRVEGRDLVYRAPNFSNSALSTRSWRSTEEPVASIAYKF